MRRIAPAATAGQWLLRAALVAACAAVIVIAWIGYGAADAQAVWAALWSLCTPAR